MILWKEPKTAATFSIDAGDGPNEDLEAINAAAVALLDANALPDESAPSLIIIPSEQQQLTGTLTFLEGGGLVERSSSMGEAQLWKITASGMGKLIGQSQVHCPRLILRYRADVALCDLNTYELLDFLRTHNSFPLAIEQGRGVAARIRELVPFEYGVQQTWYIGSRAHSVSRTYVLSLAMAIDRHTSSDEDLEPLRITHFKRESYYLSVIRAIDQNVATAMLQAFNAEESMFASEGGLATEEGAKETKSQEQLVAPNLPKPPEASPAPIEDDASDLELSEDESDDFKPPPKRRRARRDPIAHVQEDEDSQSFEQYLSSPTSDPHPSDMELLADSDETESEHSQRQRPDGHRIARAASEPSRHGIAWGPFTLARVYAGGKRRGQCIGWSCVCNRHFNQRNDRMCKKQVPLGGKHSREMSDAEALHRVKAWLVVGLHMQASRNQQRHHIAIQPRDLNLDDHPLEDFDFAVLDVPRLGEHTYLICIYC